MKQCLEWQGHCEVDLCLYMTMVIIHFQLTCLIFDQSVIKNKLWLNMILFVHKEMQRYFKYILFSSGSISAQVHPNHNKCCSFINEGVSCMVNQESTQSKRRRRSRTSGIILLVSSYPTDFPYPHALSYYIYYVLI